jgi:hypothetical protein
MKAKINMDGWLLVQRKGLWIHQFCPFITSEDRSALHCGHHCPHFKDTEDAPLRLTCVDNRDAWFDVVSDLRCNTNDTTSKSGSSSSSPQSPSPSAG